MKSNVRYFENSKFRYVASFTSKCPKVYRRCLQCLKSSCQKMPGSRNFSLLRNSSSYKLTQNFLESLNFASMQTPLRWNTLRNLRTHTNWEERRALLRHLNYISESNLNGNDY